LRVVGYDTEGYLWRVMGNVHQSSHAMSLRSVYRITVFIPPDSVPAL
jgi:hypothetical protein